MIGKEFGNYRILEELGSGGMGTVYLAEVRRRSGDLDQGARVALKVIHPHLLAAPGSFKRFLREARIGQELRHPRIVRTYDVDAVAFEGTTPHFLVLEYVEGRNLRALLGDLGALPEELCRHIGRECAGALEAIHSAGVIHRDLKPENVLITQAQEVKVMDLGLARTTGEDMTISQAGMFVGSVLYAAPEQFDADGSILDGRADLYALGLLLYEIATGSHPFADENVQTVVRRQLTQRARPAGELNPQLSPFIEELLNKLLHKRREDRFTTASEVKRTLEEGEASDWWQGHAQSLRAETKRPLRRIRIPRETDLYGRSEELDLLRAAYDKVATGSGQVVILEGEVGIGKTRLMDEFVGGLVRGGADVNFLYGTQPPGGAATVTGAFSQAYREHFGEAGLETGLGDYLSDTPDLIPAFAALLRGEPAPPDRESLSQDARQTLFLSVARSLAAERPTVLLIDDLHFAPEAGRGLFMSLALGIADAGILLVGTTRRGLDDAWLANVERLDHAARIPLRRLAEEDLERLLNDALQSGHLAADLGRRIARKSDGNPFFVFEILRSLREGRFLTKGPDGSWAQTSVIDEIQIPSSVMDLIQARIADLGREERTLLEVAACCGFEFDPLLVGETLGLQRIPLLQNLAEVEKRSRLVHSAGRRFVFDHHQVQEALYEGLPQLLREEYHAAIGETLERSHSAADREPSTLEGAVTHSLCHHFLAGGRTEAAERYLEPALRYLGRSFSEEGIVTLAGRALDASGLSDESRVVALLEKGRALGVLGRRVDEGETLNAAIELADRTRHPGRVVARKHMGWHHWYAGRYQEATRVFGEGLELAREVGNRAEEGWALGNVGGMGFDTGDFETARDAYEQQIQIAEELGDIGLLSSGQGNLALTFLYMGDFGRSIRTFRGQLELSRERGESRLVGVSFVNLGYLSYVTGDLDRAEEELRSGLETCRATFERRAESYALHHLGLVCETKGDDAGAERWFRDALNLRREVSYPSGIAETHLALGRLRLAQGRTREALEHLTEAETIATRIEHVAEQVLAVCYLARIRPDDAERAAELCRRHDKKIRVRERLEAHFVCWQTTQDPTSLRLAKELLASAVQSAPADQRTAMVRNVPLYREIEAAE